VDGHCRRGASQVKKNHFITNITPLSPKKNVVHNKTGILEFHSGAIMYSFYCGENYEKRAAGVVAIKNSLCKRWCVQSDQALVSRETRTFINTGKR
jgi:hypothetical protein